MPQQTILGTDYVGGNGLTKTNDNFTDLYSNKLDLSGGVLTGLLTSGSGDRLKLYAPTALTPRFLEARHGTQASPDLSGIPLLKVNRTIGHTEAQLVALTGSSGADGVEQLAAASFIADSTTATEVQPVGVFGSGITRGTSDLPAGGPAPDGAGGYFVGHAVAGAVKTGIGACLYGKRESDSANATGAEVTAINGGTATVTLSTGGYQRLQGLWFGGIQGTVGGGAALNFGLASGFQPWEVGLMFTSQNPVSGQTFRDHGSAAKSLFVKGTHVEGSLVVGSGSGPIIYGQDTPTYSTPPTRSYPNAFLEAFTSASADPFFVIGSNSNVAVSGVLMRNASGQLKVGVSAGANNFLTGSAAGDITLQQPTASKKLLFGGASAVGVAIAQDGTIGFNGVTTQAKPTITGSRGANAALASLLTALAGYGLLTDSTT